MKIAPQSLVTSKQAQDLIQRACAAAGLDPRLAEMRPRWSPPACTTDGTRRDFRRRDYRRDYWRLVKQRTILAYHLRNTTLPDGSIPSFPIIAYCLGLRSHSQAIHMVRVGQIHTIRAAWPRRQCP